jgi:hypothetical protein
MTIEELLISLGINVSSNFVYDFIGKYFVNCKNPAIIGLQNELASRLNIENANIKAEKIIQFLAQKGDITIIGSNIYASESITMHSVAGSKFVLGQNSSSKTDRSSIDVGNGAKIMGRNGAKIEQDKEGNIKFSA